MQSWENNNGFTSLGQLNELKTAVPYKFMKSLKFMCPKFQPTTPGNLVWYFGSRSWFGSLVTRNPTLGTISPIKFKSSSIYFVMGNGSSFVTIKWSNVWASDFCLNEPSLNALNFHQNRIAKWGLHHYLNPKMMEFDSPCTPNWSWGILPLLSAWHHTGSVQK